MYGKGLIVIFFLSSALALGMLIAAGQKQADLDQWRSDQQSTYDNRGRGCFTGGQPR